MLSSETAVKIILFRHHSHSQVFFPGGVGQVVHMAKLWSFFYCCDSFCGCESVADLGCTNKWGQ